MCSRCSAAPAPRRWTRWESAALPAATNSPYLPRVSEAEISLTESAAKRVAWIAERQHKPAVLRLAVDGGGCAGFTYKFELADGAQADHTVAQTDRVKLVVASASPEPVKGSAVGFGQ